MQGTQLIASLWNPRVMVFFPEQAISSNERGSQLSLRTLYHGSPEVVLQLKFQDSWQTFPSWTTASSVHRPHPSSHALPYTMGVLEVLWGSGFSL